MKNSICITCLFLVLSVSSFAQETHIGIKAGVNLNNISSDADNSNTKMGIGFHAGPYLSLGISDSYSLQPELLFSLQGADSDGDGDALKLSYLSVPILGKVYLNENFNIHFGPTLGFLLAAKQGDTDVKDAFRSFDFGVAAGIGYEMLTGLNLAARYNLGLGDVYDSDDIKATNQVIQLSLGYSF